MKRNLAVLQTALAAFKYIYDDQTKSYGLNGPVHLAIRGTGIGIGQFKTPDGVFRFTSVSTDMVTFDITAFSANLKYWNGPDFIPNGKYRSMLASLFHDFIWEFAKDIAEALDMTEDQVRDWGDGILYCVWMWASKDSVTGKIEAHLAWHIIQTLSPVYLFVKSPFRGASCLLVVVAMSAQIPGCPPNDWEVVEATGTNSVMEQVEKSVEGVN